MSTLSVFNDKRITVKIAVNLIRSIQKMAVNSIVENLGTTPNPITWQNDWKFSIAADGADLLRDYEKYELDEWLERVQQYNHNVELLKVDSP